MADNLNKGGFLLPMNFLSDGDFISDKNLKIDSLGPHGSSNHKSLVESVEVTTESDEEDYLSGLTCEIVRSTIEDDFSFDEGASRDDYSKAKILFGSPQSTLLPFGRRGRGSPSVPSANWDLLHTASEEAYVTRRNNDRWGYLLNQNRVPLAPHGKPSSISARVNAPISGVGLYHNQSFSSHQMQAAQPLRQKNLMNQVVQNQNRGGRSNGFVENKRSFWPPGLPPSAWPPLRGSQQQPDALGMRALFLGNNGAKRSCPGTGVFFPQRASASAEHRRTKPTRPTLHVPPKMVHALNSNVDHMDVGPQFHPRHLGYAEMSVRGNPTPQQMQRMGPQPVMSQEMRLPQDWTY